MNKWQHRTIKSSSYLKGRIGWQGLRASEFIEEGPTLITGTDFKDGKIFWDRCYHVTEERFNEASYIHIKNGDVLITKDGTIGKVAYVTEAPSKTVLNSGIFLLRCKDNSYLHNFVLHILNSHIFDNFLRKNLNGSTINHLYQNVFEKFPVPVPSLKIQGRIGQILDSINLTIEKTEALIQKYQNIKTGLMHDLFTRGIGEDGKLRPPRSEAPELYKETEIGWIPKEWKVTTAANICFPITKGTTPSSFKTHQSSKLIPYIRVENLTFDGSLNHNDNSLFIDERIHKTELLRSVIYPKDILMNIVGPPLGKVSLIPEYYDEWNTNQAIAIFRVKHDIYRYYLLYYLLSVYSQNWFYLRSKQTSGQVNLTLEMCGDLQIPLPDNGNEIQKISTMLKNIYHKIDSEKSYLKKLQKQKSGLMHDLLTGKVEVTV